MRRLLLILLSFSSCVLLNSDPYEQAYLAYQKGEEAETIKERSCYFNRALKLYKSDEKEDGKLYYNIANCYYQLNQLGMAIWYYMKAERLLPRDPKIKENLIKAKSVASISTSSWEKVLRQIFFFHYQTKSQEKAFFLVLISALLAVLVSLLIWMRKAYFKPLIYLAAFCFLALSISYFKSEQTNKKGLFVEPSLLRCDAGMQYKEVSSQIMAVGQIFKVLEISEDEKWVKVKVGPGEQGYVLAKHVRFL